MKPYKNAATEGLKTIHNINSVFVKDIKAMFKMER
jgi:hypothetical protein